MHYLDLMYRARKYVLIILAVVLFFIMICQLYIFLDQNRIISGEDIENYSQEYINTYIDLTNKYINSDSRAYLKFYNETPYSVRGVISMEHGAGLVFIPAKKRYFELKRTNKKIEEYFFNGDTHMVLFGGFSGRSGIDYMSIDTNGFALMTILNNGSVLVRDLQVNGKVYNYDILKGSNRKKDWTKQTAFEDASFNFERDLIDAFTMSEDFRRYLATPVLSDIANKILDRNDTGYYKNERGILLFRSDFEELYTVAKEYGINSQFADDLYEFNKNQKDAPSWWENYDKSGILRGLLVNGLYAIVSFIIIYFANKIRK